MALFTTHSDKNKQRLQAPFTRVARRLVLRFHTFMLWQTDTTFTERFKYVGIHRDSVDQIVAALTVEHTKTITSYILEDDGRITSETADSCVADITAVPVGGLMWEIDVNINEPGRSLEKYTQPQGGA